MDCIYVVAFKARLLLFYFSCFLIIRFLEIKGANGDTLTAHDLVTRQYEKLPYPEVKEEELVHEEDYYKRVERAPLKIHPSHTLEKLNHFFYRGKQNFQ